MLLGFEDVRRQWHATLHEHDWQLSRVFALDALLNPIEDDHAKNAIKTILYPFCPSPHRHQSCISSISQTSLCMFGAIKSEIASIKREYEQELYVRACAIGPDLQAGHRT